MSVSMKFSSYAAILAGAIGLAFAASPANAQDYGRYDNGAYSEDANIQITAPRFNAQGNRLNGPLEKVLLSTRVPYDDLNLRTRGGAYALKMRVRDAAQTTCARIAEAYPVQQAFGTNCYKTALQDGELRANAAIRDARDRHYED